jgi:hypothetical protein
VAGEASICASSHLRYSDDIPAHLVAKCAFRISAAEWTEPPGRDVLTRELIKAPCWCDGVRVKAILLAWATLVNAAPSPNACEISSPPQVLGEAYTPSSDGVGHGRAST